MSLHINGELVANECYPNNERIMQEVSGKAISKYNYGRDNPLIKFDLRYETDLDLMALIFYKKFFDDRFPKAETVLRIQYFPYSRMDRAIEGYIFSLKYMASIINDLKFDNVRVLDPHSGVTLALLDRVTELVPGNVVTRVIKLEHPDYVFYPDAGACKRYSELNLCGETPVFYGNKARDLNTGRITKYELVDAPDLADKTVLIVDDLCSKGGTFIMAAKKLKAAGAKRVALWVSHCEKSIYKGELLTTDWVDMVYTTNSILPFSEHQKIKIME